jgi:tetratricopeptide (TPR) repeat protein
MALIIIGSILATIVITSLWFASSGYVEGRTYLGWILLLVFTSAYIEFCMLLFAWLKGIESVIGFVAASLILATQGPLLLELISREALPDHSRGLKLLKVHSEAERKMVADDLAGAIEEYEKAIAEDPDDIPARFRMADLCYQNKDYSKSVNTYQELVSLKDKLDSHQYCSALMRLSEIHSQNLNDIEGARRYLHMIVEEQADTKFAEDAAARLESL